MEAIPNIFWHQGLFLQPQHFQLRDVVHGMRFNVFQTYALKHFWGVGRCEINETDLQNRRFEVLSGLFFFSDGGYVDIPGNATTIARSFEKDWVEQEKPFRVYLGLHKFEHAGKNVTAYNRPEEAAQAPTRYVTQPDPVDIPDLHGDGPPAKVRLLRLACKLFWESERERMADYVTIPLAQLERDGEQIVISRKFIPPCLNLNSSQPLVNVLREIRELAMARCRVLEQYKSPRAIQKSELDLRYMIYVMALMALNRYVPVLNHLATAPSVHPWEAYGALYQFIGELSTFSGRVNALGEGRDGSILLPAYDHENLWACFSAARRLCGELLEGLMLGPEYLIRLERQEELFTATAPEGAFKPGNAYWLVLRTKTDLTAIADSVNFAVKLSASRSIPSLVALAVPGAPLQFSPDPPAGMPRESEAFHFQIDRTSPQWLEIEKTQTITMYWSAAPEDLIAEIAVLRS